MDLRTIITKHALDRYRERVAWVPASAARALIATPLVLAACRATAGTDMQVEVKDDVFIAVVRAGHVVTVYGRGYDKRRRRLDGLTVADRVRRPGSWKQQLMREGEL